MENQTFVSITNLKAYFYKFHNICLRFLNYKVTPYKTESVRRVFTAMIIYIKMVNKIIFFMVGFFNYYKGKIKSKKRAIEEL